MFKNSVKNWPNQYEIEKEKNGINTGLLFILTVDEIIEIGIKVYCLTVGTYLLVNLWKAR